MVARHAAAPRRPRGGAQPHAAGAPRAGFRSRAQRDAPRRQAREPAGGVPPLHRRAAVHPPAAHRLWLRCGPPLGVPPLRPRRPLQRGADGGVRAARGALRRAVARSPSGQADGAVRCVERGRGVAGDAARHAARVPGGCAHAGHAGRAAAAERAAGGGGPAAPLLAARHDGTLHLPAVASAKARIGPAARGRRQRGASGAGAVELQRHGGDGAAGGARPQRAWAALGASRPPSARHVAMEPRGAAQRGGGAAPRRVQLAARTRRRGAAGVRGAPAERLRLVLGRCHAVLPAAAKGRHGRPSVKDGSPLDPPWLCEEHRPLPRALCSAQLLVCHFASASTSSIF
mmetsp:Transcript_18856/g.47618  ORF Transcript_18856/g.47618 Transcript_18856/m.47618 type:complete len:344 (-) Transcript_18856:52-1083(-)